MKNLCKSIVSTAIAAALCLSMGVSSFAAENSETTHKEETFKHIATLYEPEERSNFKQNSLYKMLGNVSQDSTISTASTKDLTMMAFTDLDTLTELTEETIAKGDSDAASSTGKFSTSYSENTAMYLLFNKEKGVWENPKYIHPSSEGWNIEDIKLKSDGTSIYAMCVESKIKNHSIDDYEMASLLTEKLPAMQIALYEYSEETHSFVPLKLFSKEDTCLGVPSITFEDNFLAVSWASISCLSVAELISGTGKAEFKFAKFAEGKWSEEETVASLDYSDITDYALISDKDGIYFVLFYSDDENNYVGIVNDKKEPLFSEKIKSNVLVSAGTLPDGSSAIYYVSDHDLYCIAKINGKFTITKMYEDISKNDITNLYVSDSRNIFYTSEDDATAVMEIEYDAEANLYSNTKSVVKSENEISAIVSTPSNNAEMLLVLGEGTKDEYAKLNEQDAEYCGFNIYFSLLGKAKDVPNVKEDKTDKDDKMTTNNDVVPTHKDAEKVTVAEDIPSTGSALSIMTFTAFGIAAATALLVIKKKED